MFARNELVLLSYPESTNVARQRLNFRERQFCVKQVRDLVVEPLTVEEYLRRPMVRRSRYLLHVFDMQQKLHRKIYQRNAREWFRETPLRVGIFGPDGLVELLASNWGPTISDRVNLVRFLARFDNCNLGKMRLGIFSDDLELIG